MGPPSDADRAQADALCDELHEQIAVLDVRGAKLRAGLTRYVSEGRKGQVTRVQREWRAVMVERRQIINMLTALGHSYPCDHRGTIKPR